MPNTNILDESRRNFLVGAASTAIIASTTGVSSAVAAPAANKTFPKGFLWGAATAAHQIEGNDTNSDFWFLENLKGTTFKEPVRDGDDSLNRYQEDIALLAGIGLNTYRFSIEWSRIETERDVFSVAYLDYYKRVIECCHKNNVKPAVTFFHSTAPRWFAEAGGFLNPDAPAMFAKYCSMVAKTLADGMMYAFTINEPQVAKTFRLIPGAAPAFVKRDAAALEMHQAASLATNSKQFVTMEYPDIEGMTPLLVSGHEMAYSAIKAERSSLPVGVTLNVIDFEPSTDDSPYEEIRKSAYGAWIDAIHRAGDFTGVQNYREFPIAGKGKKLPPLAPLNFTEKGMMGPFLRPEALGNSVDYIYAQTKKPILVSENGLETDDDAHRILYIDAALASLHASITKGVPVLGYIHWSLLDNFEWLQGYKPKFGLFSVDRSTFKRTPKPSAAHLGDIAKRNAIG